MKRFACVLAALLVTQVGCSGGGSGAGSSPSAEATVRGTIKINGKPADKGEITFDGSSKSRPNEGTRTAAINADGTYEIRAAVGQNVVRAAGALVDQYRGLGYDSQDFVVKPGENVFNIEFEWMSPTESSEDQ